MFFLFTFYLKFFFRYEKSTVTVRLRKQGSYKRGQTGTNGNNTAIHTSTQCRRLQPHKNLALWNRKRWSVRDCVMCLMPAAPLVLRTNWSPKEMIIQPFLQENTTWEDIPSNCFVRGSVRWTLFVFSVIPVAAWGESCRSSWQMSEVGLDQGCYSKLLHNDGVRKCWFNFKLRAPEYPT